ncbi:MAG: glycosyltransferase family 2 protein [Thermomicrobiales bacterium]
MSGTVSVVIVTYNGRALLESCLLALFGGSRCPDEIIVIDNDSTDDTVPWLHHTYPVSCVLRCSANLGFAAANNAGIRASSGSFVMTLNNDTQVAPDALARLTTTLDEADASVGAAMSTMVFAESPTIIASAGLETFTNGVVRDAGVGEAINPRRAPFPIFGPSAGAALYRRAALDDVGLFDPAFFMYLEDADLAWRLRLRRWSTVTVPDAIIRHAVSATAGYGSPRKVYYLARNRWWCIAKNMPGALLRECAVPIARYDAAAFAYAMATGDRASLMGRHDALAECAVLRKARSRIQACVTASDDEIRQWLQPAPPLTAPLRERQVIRALIRGK